MNGPWAAPLCRRANNMASNRGWVTVSRYLVCVIGALACLSCATVKNTPQQDYVYEMGRICETSAGITSTKIQRVAPDGRYWIRARSDGFAHEYPLFFQCMKEQSRAHPFLDWLKAQKRAPSEPPVAVGSTSPLESTASGAIVAPVWQVGDEWQFAWKSPSGSGSFAWSVERIDVLDGVQHYVLRTGTREIFYRITDLALSIEKVDGVIVRRDTPPLMRYSWPLTEGKSWEQDSTTERPVDRQSTNISQTWTVDRGETVTVPAGTFATVKIIAKNKKSGATITEAWYAPAVKQWVKDREYLTAGIRERELMAFKLDHAKKDSKTLARMMPELPPTKVTDDAEAVRRYRQRAEAGDGRAMASLGFMYFAGRGGLAKNDAEAVRWYRRGAEAGNGFAMAFLGVSYWNGLGGLPRDEAEAVKWFRKGADAGEGRAMAMLGQMYLTGGGLETNEAEAVRWFQRGAENGDGRAMVMLGQMYLTGGGGLPRDDAEAVRWFRKGAAADDGLAMATLGRMHEMGDSGLAKDDVEAVRWYQKGVAVGNGRAMAELGNMYLTGRGGLAKNDAQALRWFRAGADLFDALAMFDLGQAYEAGQGVTKDRDEAMRWYRKSASFGLPEAFDRLRALGDEP
ncbi:MAG: hypothetical protein C5B48_11800 [Candidatus Rokuibacteriota bacterium]|nr:MAG: hypothetical protein C5B48_11800 [Candidatus Rokubacteria bacterium]